MARSVRVVFATVEARSSLVRRASGRANPHRERFCVRIVLRWLEGISVGKWDWSSRFEKSGHAAIEDKRSRGCEPSLPDDTVASVVTQASRPAKGRTRWTVRTMARHVGISSGTAQRIRSKNDLKPHAVRTFNLSNDPKFEQKFRGVIGVHLNQPEKALVLCCDEKGRSQAQERSEADLPSAPGQALIQISDYRRHGGGGCL